MNAYPDPDFKYCSKRITVSLSSKTLYCLSFQEENFIVLGFLPVFELLLCLLGLLCCLCNNVWVD